MEVELGQFFQGIVKGDPNSIVSFSISDGQVSAIISTDKGNFVLGEITDSESYILYNDKDLNSGSGFECGLNEQDLQIFNDNTSLPPSSIESSVACRAVQIYFEADNKIFTDQGSNMTTAANFVNTLFGQVAVLYQNENIEIELSTVKIWDTVDPYISAASTSSMLNQFSAQVGTTFTGDLAHLISGRSLNGGIAYVNVLCSKGTGISAAIGTNVVNVPTFSWNVGVVTHEIGHNFGSSHTQSCTWPGGPIDNCVPVEDGDCETGPTPTNGGTIMSYCHVTAIGVNFNNGFGTLPGNLIRKNAAVFSTFLIGNKLFSI